MKRISVVITLGLLALGSVCRADVYQSTPSPTPQGCSQCCDAPTCKGKRHPILQWLTYRPLTHGDKCGCRKPNPFHWPLYTWFLDRCAADCGCGVYNVQPAGPAPIAPGQVAPTQIAPSQVAPSQVVP